VALAATLLVTLFPFYWLAVVAVTPHLTVWGGADLVPTTISPEGFVLALRTVDWGLALANSLLIAGGSTLLVLGVSIPAGYAFGRLEFFGRRPLFVLTLLVFVFPPEAVGIPLYEVFLGLTEIFGVTPPRLYNTHLAVVLPTSVFLLPLAIGLLTVFFRGMPDSLEDAARVAGATRMGALRHVLIPLARPGILSVAALVFVQSYTEYFFTSFMTDGYQGAGYTVQSQIHGIVSPLWQLAYPNMAAVAGLLGLLPSFLVLLYISGRLESWLDAWTAVTR
jgi:multiple sugar transport system permease protein